jgi:hypothetical protein
MFNYPDEGYSDVFLGPDLALYREILCVSSRKELRFRLRNKRDELGSNARRA